MKSKRWETSVEACLGLRDKSLLVKFTVYFFEGEIASFNVCTSCKEQDGKSYHLHDDKNLEHFFEKKLGVQWWVFRNELKCDSFPSAMGGVTAWLCCDSIWAIMQSSHFGKM